MEPELQIHNITEQDHAYVVSYSLVDDFGIANVDVRIRKSYLKQFVIEKELNVMESFDYERYDVDQTCLDVTAYLEENYSSVIESYLGEGLSC